MTELTPIIAKGLQPVTENIATEEMKKKILKCKFKVGYLNREIMMLLRLSSRDRNFERGRQGPVRMSLLRRQRKEIQIEKLNLQIDFEKIKFDILKFMKTNHPGKILETVELAENAIKDVDTYIKEYHQELKFMDAHLWGTAANEIKDVDIVSCSVDLYNRNKGRLNSTLKKLNYLRCLIHCMKEWIFSRKMRMFVIKDIKIIDEKTAKQFVEFNESSSMDNEEKTYKNNCELTISHFTQAASSTIKKLSQAEKERKQNKANGLYFARETRRKKRYCQQYWHLTSEPITEQESNGVGLKTQLDLELPVEGLGDPLGWSKDRIPLFLQIYSVKLTCCSNDVDPDYSVQVSGCISVDPDYSMQVSGCISPGLSFPVKRQTLTKKDPYLLLGDLAFIPLFEDPCDPKIHVKLMLKSPDEPDKVEHHNVDLQATRSMEVEHEVYMSGKEFIEGTSVLCGEVKWSTGKHYMLRLTHGIVVNTIVASISVHPLQLSFSEGDVEIIAVGKHNAELNIVLLDSKKVPVTLDKEGCFQLLRRSICVDYFDSLTLYVACFGTGRLLEFDPRDSCDCQKALEEKIEVRVTWSY